MKGIDDYEMVFDVCFRMLPYRSAIMSVCIMNLSCGIGVAMLKLDPS